MWHIDIYNDLGFKYIYVWKKKRFGSHLIIFKLNNNINQPVLPTCTCTYPHFTDGKTEK